MRKSAFTLPELLTVITILSLLMMASFGSLARARALAKRAKGETQLRELVSAWQQYFTTYEAWPRSLAGQTISASASTLSPLIDPDDSDNEYGIVFYNFSGTGSFDDPWGNPYRLKFGSVRTGGSSQDRSTTAFETTVALPRRMTLLP